MDEQEGDERNDSAPVPEQSESTGSMMVEASEFGAGIAGR